MVGHGPIQNRAISNASVVFRPEARISAVENQLGGDPEASFMVTLESNPRVAWGVHILGPGELS